MKVEKNNAEVHSIPCVVLVEFYKPNNTIYLKFVGHLALGLVTKLVEETQSTCQSKVIYNCHTL